MGSEPDDRGGGSAAGTWRGLVDAARTGMALVAADGTIRYANRHLHATFGYDDGVLDGRHVREFTDARGQAALRARLAPLLAGSERRAELDLRVLVAEGRWRWARAQVSVIEQAPGSADVQAPATWFAVVVEDSDERRELDPTLEHDRMLRRLAGSLAGVGGWAVEVPSMQATWSDEIFRILEWPAGESPSVQESLELFDPEDRERLASAIEGCATHGEAYDLEVRLRSRVGRPMWARSMAEAQRDANGRIVRIVGAFQDITEMKQAAFESAELAQRLRLTLESITDAFYTLDTDWRFTYVNAQAERLLRRSREELLGRHVLEAFPEAADGELAVTYRAAMRDQRAAALENLHYAPLDTWFDVHVYPSTQGIAVYFQDVSDRVERERTLERIAADEQAAAERLRELDRVKNAFLSAVSHELRTPLTVVQGLAATLQRTRGGLDEVQRAELEDALVGQADRLGGLLNDLLDVDRLSRGGLATRRVEVDVGGLVRSVVAETPVGDRVELAVADTPVACVDPVQVQRIVTNLLDNAAKYAPEGRIEVHVTSLGTAGVRIEVLDEGPGIPAEERERVFEPLYRMDDDHPRPGTGIGLALVAAFAQVHDGRAYVAAREAGAHVVVELPDPADVTTPPAPAGA